jgi:hypothetical protein
MIDDTHRIYFERLREGHTEQLQLTLQPDFLATEDGEIVFPDPVQVEGEVYVAEEHLVLCLHLHAQAVLPCLMCSGPAVVELNLGQITHLEALADHHAGIFELMPLFREIILSEVPPYAECHHGNCPERKQIEHYFTKTPKGQNKQKKIKGEEKDEELETYRPFADLL